MSEHSHDHNHGPVNASPHDDDDDDGGGERPESPADPRPGGEPYYIDSTCPECETELVLNDEHRPTGDGTGARVAPEVWDERETVFHDEWVCPSCENGIHMDWPEHLRSTDCSCTNRAGEQDASTRFDVNEPEVTDELE